MVRIPCRKMSRVNPTPLERILYTSNRISTTNIVSVSQTLTEMGSIVEFFKDKNIFITGGSGFIGKVLIEKLLRCCPEIGDIYLLIRSRKGRTPQERIDDILKNPLFNSLREKYPKSLEKVKPIEGDVTLPKLGISDQDEEVLTSNVHIIYHGAASVRFDDHLKDAIICNVRSASDIANLALKIKYLQVLVHISTAYCHLDKPVIEEKFYRSKVHWKDAIILAEKGTNDVEVLSQKFIDPMPNTYVYTKNIAESAMVDICKDKIDLVVLRPSIVFIVVNDPIPGWIDNMNGPFALSAAALKGVYSQFYGNENAVLDMVYVDNIVKGLIISTWEKAKESNASKATFYNGATDIEWPLYKFKRVIRNILEKVPLTGRLWYTRINFTKCWYHHHLQIILTHTTMAIFIDTLLRIIGKKPMLLKLIRRIYIANGVLNYFMTRTVKFRIDNYRKLPDKLVENDRADFTYTLLPDNHENDNRAAVTAVSGMKKFILNEPVPVAPETFINNKRFRQMEITIKLLWIISILYIIVWKYGVISKMETILSK